MGCADFYISVVGKKDVLDVVNNELKKFDYIYKISCNDKIEIEGYFDNFIITVKVLYSILKNYKNTIKIRSLRDEIIFNFNSEIEFLNWLYSLYNEKINNYYKVFGVLFIPSDDYYKRRNKFRLRKYYKKVSIESEK